MKHYIGIDLGGTNTKIGVVDSEGNLINSKIIKTHSHQNVDKTLERIWETAKKLILEKEIPLFSVMGIGIISFVEDKEEKAMALNEIMFQNMGKKDWDFPEAMLNGVAVFKIEVTSLSCKEHL